MECFSIKNSNHTNTLTNLTVSRLWARRRDLYHVYLNPGLIPGLDFEHFGPRLINEVLKGRMAGWDRKYLWNKWLNLANQMANKCLPHRSLGWEDFQQRFEKQTRAKNISRSRPVQDWPEFQQLWNITTCTYCQQISKVAYLVLKNKSEI